MGWLAQLFGRKPPRRLRFERRQWQASSVAPQEAAGDPDWAWRTLVAWWDRTEAGIPIGGASEETLAALERRYGIVLPPDFRAYLQNACPSAEEMDWESVTWWHLDRICNVPDGFEHPVGTGVRDQGRRYVFFADYLIWSWAWAVCCEPGPDWGTVVVIDRDAVVANSFSDFVAGYLSDPNKMA